MNIEQDDPIIHFFHSFVKITVKNNENVGIFTILVCWSSCKQTILYFSLYVVKR